MTMVQATPAAMTASGDQQLRSAPRESTWETICQRSTARWAVATMATAPKKSAPITLTAMRHRLACVPLCLGHRLRIGSIGRRVRRPHPKAAPHYHGQDAPPTRATMRLRAPRAVTLPPFTSSGRGRSTARRGWSIWAYRSLIWNFTQRDLKARGTRARCWAGSGRWSSRSPRCSSTRSSSRSSSGRSPPTSAMASRASSRSGSSAGSSPGRSWPNRSNWASPRCWAMVRCSRRSTSPPTFPSSA